MSAIETRSSLPHTAVPFSRMRFDDLFWQPRLETNRRVTIPLILERLKSTGRVDALRLEWKPGGPNPPHAYWESDVAKWMEAAAYSLRTHPDPKLEAKLEEVVHLFVRAQQPDGYLNVYYTVVEPAKRWSNLRDQHELYNAGHLIEAAVAHFETTGTRILLDVACRYVDYIAAVFGEGPGQKRGYCGHPEIELALVKLYRVTRQTRYLDLCKYFLMERGRLPHYFDLEARARGEDPQDYRFPSHEYTLSHLPVHEQLQPVGHAVRAMYLYCALADLAHETADISLREQVELLWSEVTGKQMYITGGIGSSRENEGFTTPFNLPNESAYAETCAAIGLLLLSHRLLQASCDSRYADEMERILYNGILSGISLDGRRFFYTNPLALKPEMIGNDDRYLHAERAEWFDCACCPPNLARLLGSLGQFFYSESESEIAIHLYAQSEVVLHVAGQEVVITVQSDYPWKADVSVGLDLHAPAEFCLKLRLPFWCREASLLLNGKSVPAELEKGYIPIRRRWSPRDQLLLKLAMPVERVYADARVLADFGRVALQRGPLIYCVEGVDLGAPLESLSLPVPSNLIALNQRQLFGGVTTIQGEASVIQEVGRSRHLYRFHPGVPRPLPFTAIPYYCRANRGRTEMQVWLRESGA